MSYGGPDVGLLCAAGKVKKVVFGFVSLDSIPLEPHFRAARQRGAIEAIELDEGMFYLGLLAAAQRLPFLPTRAGLGSDVSGSTRRSAPCVALRRRRGAGGRPRAPLDAALVHMNRADATGNGQFLGPDPYFDHVFLGAAERRFLSAERVVDTDELRVGGSAPVFVI